MSEFGVRLREERLRLNYSQQEFCVFGGVARNAQSNYEKGERVPDADYLAGISEKGADVSYVLTGIRMNAFGAELSSEESALLDNYRHLGGEQKESINKVSEAMAALYKTDSKASK